MLQPSSHSISFEAALRDLTARDPRVRAAAANALGDLPDDLASNETSLGRAAAALVAMLKDPRHEVRTTAALALGDLGHEQAVSALIGSIGDVVSDVRQAAIIALGRIGSALAWDVLAGSLRDGSPEVRFQAALSLAEIDRVRAFDPLVAALSDEDAEVRENVIAALGLVGDPRAVGWIAKALDEPRPATRFVAAQVLADMRDERALLPLLEFLGDSQLAFAAIEALETLGDKRAVPRLGQEMQRRWLRRLLRIRVAAAILAIDPRHAHALEARALLAKAKKAWSADVRGLALESLERLENDPGNLRDDQIAN